MRKRVKFKVHQPLAGGEWLIETVDGYTQIYYVFQPYYRYKVKGGYSLRRYSLDKLKQFFSQPISLEVYSENNTPFKLERIKHVS